MQTWLHGIMLTLAVLNSVAGLSSGGTVGHTHTAAVTASPPDRHAAAVTASPPGRHMGSLRNVSEVHSMCPGAAEFYLNRTDPLTNPVEAVNCKQVPKIRDMRFQRRWVYGQCEDSLSFCQVLIQVPRSRIVRVRIEFPMPNAVPDASSPLNSRGVWGIFSYEQKHNRCLRCGDLEMTQFMQRKNPQFYFSTTNELFFYYRNRPPLKIRFESVERGLDVRYTSEQSGFVLLRYEEGRGRVCDHLTAPDGHVIMISFQRYLVKGCDIDVTFHYMASDSTQERVEKIHYDPDRMTKVYDATHLEVCVVMGDFTIDRKLCFKLLFSFHSEHRVPQTLGGSLYNCSVDYYWRFRKHLHCNVKVECEDERDELEDCPSSSSACRGWVKVGSKCYKSFKSELRITPGRAHTTCQERGFQLASVKTQQEFEDFKEWFLLGRNVDSELIGFMSASAFLPPMYAGFYSWSDKTVIYNVLHINLKYSLDPDGQNYVYHVYDMFDSSALYLSGSYARGGKLKSFICEKPVQSQGSFLSQPVELFFDHQSSLSSQPPHPPHPPHPPQPPHPPVVVCPGGHLTHTFLSCDPKSLCGQTSCFFVKETQNASVVLSASQHSTDAVAMYPCASGDAEVSYSLLCDFRLDCEDSSDESFCLHLACTQFTCTNGQCVSTNKHCNKYMDCVDGSDEKGCPLEEGTFFRNSEYQNKNMSYLIDLDGRGYFTQRAMNLTDPCPGTHYRCTKEWFYCLPVYTRCNGVFDCVFQEDERDCEGWTCPGLYRCRGSSVCVHADHMCDGWSQCPQYDDEWLCDLICPAQCLCQGHAFLCAQSFSAHLFPQLRYLNAEKSGMSPSDLGNNTHIVHLNLDQCSISVLCDMEFPNLRFLELSHNRITRLNMAVFTETQNLQVLVLKWNPLTSVVTSSPNKLKNLRKFDLSGTLLRVFDSNLLSCTPNIQVINLSLSSIQSIGSGGFQAASLLTELDMTGLVLRHFSLDLFRGLHHLHNIYASNYKLCCREVLPKVIPLPRCLVPKHHLSSCGDMLQSEVHRLGLWSVAVLAVLGNVACLVCHCVKSPVPIPYVGPVVTFMTSLQCADLCMGMYAGVIAVGHETSRGRYVHFEDRWTGSIPCHAAGLLSLLSCQVSMLTVFLLTFQHLALLCLPHSTYRFSQQSAVVTCGVTWLVGVLLACVPLCPALSHWEHYGHTALCTLMLHSDSNLGQEFRFSHAMLVFNLCNCLMVVVSQVLVYRATPQHRILIKGNTNPAFTSVDLQMRIAATDVTRWMVVTTATVLAFAGLAVIDVNVFMAVMVLPLNSVVNPLLCMSHAVTFRQMRKQEERLLRVLKSRNTCVKTTLKEGHGS